MKDDSLDSMLQKTRSITNDDFASLPLGVVEHHLKEEIMNSTTTARKGEKRWAGLVGVAAAAVVLVAGVSVIGSQNSQTNPTSPSYRWAASVQEVADSAPRYVVTAPGWKTHSVNEFEKGAGSVVFANDQAEQAIEFQWGQPGSFGAVEGGPGSEKAGTVQVGSKSVNLVKGATSAVSPRNPNEVTDVVNGGEIAGVWEDGGLQLKVSGMNLKDAATFRSVVESFRSVSSDEWLSGLPELVVKPEMRVSVMDEYKQGLTLPTSFDADAIASEGLVNDRAQLGTLFTRKLSCALVAQYVTGDADAQREAAEGMASVRASKAFADAGTTSDFAGVITEYADALNGKRAGVSSGAGPNSSVASQYQSALGCS